MILPNPKIRDVVHIVNKLFLSYDVYTKSKCILTLNIMYKSQTPYAFRIFGCIEMITLFTFRCN